MSCVNEHNTSLTAATAVLICREVRVARPAVDEASRAVVEWEPPPLRQCEWCGESSEWCTGGCTGSYGDGSIYNWG